MEPFTQAETIWTDPATSKPYLLRVTHAMMDGRAEVIGVEMWGITPPADWLAWRRTLDTVSVVTCSALRLPLRRISRDALNDVRTRWAPLVARSSNPAARELAETAMTAPDHRQGRPPLYGHDHWERVASIYHTGGRTPVRAVAAAFEIPTRLARRWVGRARQMGLLDR